MTPHRQSPHLTRGAITRARALRWNTTDAERALWRGLRQAFAAAHFRRQVPLGPYFADFASHRCRLVLEIDGGQHAEAANYDAARTKFLESQGYRVLRFWNNDVLQNMEGVLTQIATALPSPLVGEGGAKRRMGGAAAKQPRGAKAPHPHPNPPHKGEGVGSTSPPGRSSKPA